MRFEILPSDPIDTPPIVAVAAVRFPAIEAEVAVRPEDVRAFPDVPTVTPELLTVVVPAVKVSALTLEAVTVPVVVRPESERVDAPVVKDSDVTEFPVTVVFAVPEPTVTESVAETVLKATSSAVATSTEPSSSSDRVMLSAESKLRVSVSPAARFATPFTDARTPVSADVL